MKGAFSFAAAEIRNSSERAALLEIKIVEGSTLAP